MRRLLFGLLAERWPHLSADELKFRIAATRIAMAGLMSAVLDNPGVSHGASLGTVHRSSRQILQYIMRAMSEPEASARKPGSVSRSAMTKRSAKV